MIISQCVNYRATELWYAYSGRTGADNGAFASAQMAFIGVSDLGFGNVDRENQSHPGGWVFWASRHHFPLK